MLYFGTVAEPQKQHMFVHFHERGSRAILCYALAWEWGVTLTISHQGELVKTIIRIPQLRSTLIGLTYLGFLISTSAHALGLGEITVGSVLNQPLDAEIRVLGADRSELDRLQVELAPPEAFKRLGLTRSYFLTNLEFAIVTGRQGESIIKVTSKLPVREPFLSFLVQAQWPSGRLYREYTVLLDPPTYTEPVPAPSPAARPTATTTTAAPTAGQRDTASRVEATATTVPLSGANKYTVRPNDTLWEIAKRVRPDTTITMEQMMIGLRDTNPAAFIDNNINGVRQGYVLQIPDVATLQAIGPNEARAAVSQQMASWAEYRTQATTASPPRTTPADRTLPAQTGKLARPPGREQTAAAAVEAAPYASEVVLRPPPAQETGERTSTKTAGTVSEVDAVRQRNLEALRAENERLVADNARLEQALDEVQTSLESTQARLVQAQEQIVIKDQALAKLNNQLSDSSSGREPEPSFLGDVMFGPIGLAASALLGLFLALLGTAALRKRQTAKASAQTDASAEDTMGFELPPVTKAKPKAPAGEPVTLVKEPPPETEIPVSSAQTPVPPKETPPPLTLPPKDDTPPLGEKKVSDTQDDILAEANVYLAYGLHQQAEDLLRKSVRQFPERQDYRLKLLETLHGAKDRAAFIKVAEQWHQDTQANPTANLWQQAQAMGHELAPEHALFISGANTPTRGQKPPPEDYENADDVIIIDDDLGETEALDMEDTQSLEDSGELDFDMEDLQFAREQAGESRDQRDTAEMSLDFDIDQTTPSAFAKAPSKVDTMPPSASPTVSHGTDQSNDDDSDLAEPTLILDVSEELQGLSERFHARDAAESAPTTPAEGEEDFFATFDLDTGDFGVEESKGEEELKTVLKSPVADEPQVEELDLRSAPADESLEFLGDDLETFTLGAQTDADESGASELETQLELARAYIDMGDGENARNMLNEIVEQGSETQRAKAQAMLGEIR